MHIKCVYDIIPDINKKHYQLYFTIVYEQCYWKEMSSSLSQTKFPITLEEQEERSK